jgi:DNA-3-methyladenine glycosylase II
LLKRFGAPVRVPVRDPFRLDLTVDALRRLASNVVDVVDSGGTYYRAVRDEASTALLAVRAVDGAAIEFQATGRSADRWTPVVERLLGTAADLSEWYRRSGRIAWLRPIAAALRGLKPPRYPTLWEACAHAIVFQQISIHAAASIMRRAVEALGEPVSDGSVCCVAFPSAERWRCAGNTVLRAAGLSRNKIAHLRSAAAAFDEGSVDEAALQTLSTPAAAQRLCTIRGIGPWSASVVLLRGMGRLDVFPLRDSGVARSLALLSGDAALDQATLLQRLGPVRGMLYYHLLLGRLRNLVPT